MPHINPDTLGHLMGNMTQAQLIEKSRVGKATISRIFSGKVEKQNENTTKRLAEALGVSVDALCKPIDKEAAAKAQLQKLGVQMLRATLDGDAWWNFDLVAQRYGISVLDQLKFAPTAIMLLVEASLAERKSNLAEIEAGIAQVEGNTPEHLRMRIPIHRAEEVIWNERASIERRDIFGKMVSLDAIEDGFDPDDGNPFADFIDRMIETLGAPVDVRKKYLGMPDTGLWEYQIDAAEFDRITGSDPRATMALNRVYVRLRDVPDELMSDDQAEARINWLRAKLPDAIWAKHEADMAAFATMTLDDLGL